MRAVVLTLALLCLTGRSGRGCGSPRDGAARAGQKRRWEPPLSEALRFGAGRQLRGSPVPPEPGRTPAGLEPSPDGVS